MKMTASPATRLQPGVRGRGCGATARTAGSAAGATGKETAGRTLQGADEDLDEVPVADDPDLVAEP